MNGLSRMFEAMSPKARDRTTPFLNGIRFRSDSQPILECSALGGEKRVSSRLPLRQYQLNTTALSDQGIEAAFVPAPVMVRRWPNGDPTARDHFIVEESHYPLWGNATGKRGNLKKGVEIVGGKLITGCHSRGIGSTLPVRMPGYTVANP